MVGTVTSRDGDREPLAKGTGVTGGCRAVAPPAWDRDGDAFHLPHPTPPFPPPRTVGTLMCPRRWPQPAEPPSTSPPQPPPHGQGQDTRPGCGGTAGDGHPPGTHRAAGKSPLPISPSPSGALRGHVPPRPLPGRGGCRCQGTPRSPEGGEDGAPRRLPRPPAVAASSSSSSSSPPRCPERDRTCGGGSAPGGKRGGVRGSAERGPPGPVPGPVRGGRAAPPHPQGLGAGVAAAGLGPPCPVPGAAAGRGLCPP